MDIAEMWKVLKRDYGIQTMADLETALKNSKGINIGVFTEGVFTKGGNYDSEGISAETERRASA